MYEVYRDRDSSKVGLYDSLLKSAGIRTMLRNWNGSNITEIPIPDMFPNICVFTENDAVESRKIIKEYIEADSSELPAWVCSECGETVDGVFSECWACQAPYEKGK